MSDIPAQVHGAKLVYFFELSKYFAIFEQKNLIALVYSQKTQYLYTNFCYKLLEDKQIHHSGKQIVANLHTKKTFSKNALIPHYGDSSSAALGVHSVVLLQVPNLQYAYSIKIETASLKP